MAIGFPASYTTHVDMVGSRQDAREAVLGTFDALGWRHEVINVDVYRVRMPMNGFSWGETITISLTDEGTTLVESKCRWPLQIIDWGQNKRNALQFTARFTIREIREAKSDYKNPIYLDDMGHTPVERLIMGSEPELVRKKESN